MPRMAPRTWAIAAVLLSSVAAQAQDIRWRPDYSTARKEAAATGKTSWNRAPFLPSDNAESLPP